jgi:hypothetical protein
MLKQIKSRAEILLLNGVQDLGGRLTYKGHRLYEDEFGKKVNVTKCPDFANCLVSDDSDHYHTDFFKDIKPKRNLPEWW